MNQVVINDFCKIDIKKGSVVTIGKFDGVHKGHQKLIKYTVNMAKKYNLLSVVMMIRRMYLFIIWKKIYLLSRLWVLII